MSASPALISPVSQQRQCLGGGESHLEVLPGGVLESHGQEVGPALGQGHSEDGGLSLLRFTSLFADKREETYLKSSGQELWFTFSQGDLEEGGVSL